MASQASCAPTPPKAQEKDKKTEPQGLNMKPPLADGAPEPHRVPLPALIKVYGHLHRQLLEGRRARILPTLNPLHVDEDLPLPEKLMTEKEFRGNQGAVSKVRIAFRWRGRWLVPHTWGGHKLRENPRETHLALLRPLVKLWPSHLPEAHLLG